MSKKSFLLAMGCYSLLMLLATFTLDGSFRLIALLALVAYAAKMGIGYLRDRQ